MSTEKKEESFPDAITFVHLKNFLTQFDLT